MKREDAELWLEKLKEYWINKDIKKFYYYLIKLPFIKSPHLLSLLKTKKKSKMNGKTLKIKILKSLNLTY